MKSLYKIMFIVISIVYTTLFVLHVFEVSSARTEEKKCFFSAACNTDIGLPALSTVFRLAHIIIIIIFIKCIWFRAMCRPCQIVGTRWIEKYRKGRKVDSSCREVSQSNPDIWWRMFPACKDFSVAALFSFIYIAVWCVFGVKQGTDGRFSAKYYSMFKYSVFKYSTVKAVKRRSNDVPCTTLASAIKSESKHTIFNNRKRSHRIFNTSTFDYNYKNSISASDLLFLLHSCSYFIQITLCIAALVAVSTDAPYRLAVMQHWSTVATFQATFPQICVIWPLQRYYGLPAPSISTKLNCIWKKYNPMAIAMHVRASHTFSFPQSL